MGRAHTRSMIEVVKSATFDRWLSGLRDLQARARIETRIRRVSLGHMGDVRPVGGGISELRIDHGPGYRVYLLQRGPVLVLLLCGGDKRSQQTDIARAMRIAELWEG